MDSVHPLKALLQLQLASDAQAVLHLPYVISSLNSACLQPSEHTQKWSTRINSLILSKDGGARWAGLCIAFKTSVFSRPLMIECAQSWVGAALPLLSKNESVPTLKAAIRLLRYIFTNATDIPEFQRQLSTPNVPKFSQALHMLAQKNPDQTLKVLALETLTHLVPVYPTLHRALQASLSSLALRFLNGSAPQPVQTVLVEAASRLYAVLHHTGGKVGSTAQWRKALDDTVSFAWGSFLNIRTTFPAGSTPRPPPPKEDPVIAIPLNFDRLRTAIHIFNDLLQASNLRPVVLPIGSLVRLCVALIRCTSEEKIEGHVDPVIHALELSVIPDIRELGCKLVNALARCAGKHLTPHLSQLLFYVTYHLEQHYPPSQRLPFLQTTNCLLENCGLPHDTLVPSRLMRAILPSLTVILSTQSDVQENESAGANTGKGRKGKKRARGYEGDEVFKVTRVVICPTKTDGEVLLAALSAVQLLLRQGQLAPAIQSVAVRTILSVQLNLPQIPPALLSPDVTLHGKVRKIVSSICRDLSIGTSSTMSKSLGLVIGTSLQDSTTAPIILRDLEVLLHPRLPPLLRSLPHVETISLFRAEESQEEIDARKALELVTMEDLTQQQSAHSAAETVTQQQVPQVVPQPLIEAQQQPIAPSYSQGILPAAAPRPAYTSSIPILPTSTAQASSLIAPSTTSISQTGVENFPQGETSSASFGTQAAKPTATALPPNSLSAPSTSTAATSTEAGPSSPSTFISPAAQALLNVAADEDEDEPMPSIDMDSDSD